VVDGWWFVGAERGLDGLIAAEIDAAPGYVRAGPSSLLFPVEQGSAPTWN